MLDSAQTVITAINKLVPARVVASGALERFGITERRCFSGFDQPERVNVMQQKQFYKPVRICSFIVLALMVTAVVYAVSISAFYWNGIGV